MSTVTISNPFRVGTKLHRIFEYMKDSNYHSLVDITSVAYNYEGTPAPLACRQVGSALRTIRATPGLDVNTWDRRKWKRPFHYRMHDA